jgi:hypothetical protein
MQIQITFEPPHINPTLTSNLSAFKNQPGEVTTPPEDIFLRMSTMARKICL